MDKPGLKEESRNDAQKLGDNDPAKESGTYPAKGGDPGQHDIDVPKVPSAYPAEGAD